ncbi:MAG: CoA-binding protein [Actinomycetota bacterium]
MNPARLRPLLSPRSIAVVGASESPDSWAPEIERSLRHLGFDGELYPVNPKYDEVWGRPCRAGVEELPRGVDLAVIVVPARVAVRMVDACGRAGVRSAMVVSSGFAEAGEEGRRLQDDLRGAARAHDLPVLGPNVEGFVNYVERVAPYGTAPPPRPVPGSIAVLSQSGTVAWTMSQLASDRGAGLRIILGVGNEAVLGLGDLFAWAASDPHTRVVTSYVETMRDVEGIGRGLDALRAARKPVLICAPEGRSEAARRSIVAHTGALAGDTALRDAWFRGHGVVLIDDPVTMFEAALLLAHHRRLRTPGIAAALQSGGACTLFAEAAGARGLELPEFSAATRRRLRRALPAFASQNNPLDVTGQAAVETRMFRGALRALAGDPAVGLVAFDAFPPRTQDDGVWAEPVIDEVRALRRGTGVVFVSVSMSALAYGEASHAFVRRSGIPFLQGHRAATGAIRALVELQDATRRATPDLPPHAGSRPRAALLRGSGPPDEAEASPGRLRRPAPRRGDRARSAARRGASRPARIGFPVAVKALALELPHKAKLGGVHLGLRNGTDVEIAAADVLEAATRAGRSRPRVLVQAMVSGAEVLVGAVIDERFGACVTMRLATLAEAGDATFVAAPLRLLRRPGASSTSRWAMRAPRPGPPRPRRHGSRRCGDRPGGSRPAWASTSPEANPLLVSARGAVAVDALAEVRPPVLRRGGPQAAAARDLRPIAALGFGLADFEAARWPGDGSVARWR